MSERTVVLSEVTDDDAKQQHQLERERVGNVSMDGIEKAVPKFNREEGYTTFIAEYAVRGDDLVFHFYLTPELDAEPKDGPVAVYWMRTFPSVLDATAQSFFNATAPRLQAKYTQELQSWWLLAQGFGMAIDPEKLALSFLEKLDGCLDEA